MPLLAVGVRCHRSHWIDDGGEVAPVIVLPEPYCSVRLPDPDRQPQLVVLSGCLAAIRASDADEVAGGIVGVAGGAPEWVGAGQQPIIGIPLGDGGMPERVDLADHLAQLIKME